jgi:C-terminal processing protease CtpA/Prc
LAFLSRYVSASTPAARRRDAVNRLLRGAHGSITRLVVEKGDGSKREILVERRNEWLRPSTKPATGETVRPLPSGIGYIDLRALMPHEVSTAFEKVNATPGLILDMRGYLNNTRFLVAAKIARGTAQSSALPRASTEGSASRKANKTWVRFWT